MKFFFIGQAYSNISLSQSNKQKREKKKKGRKSKHQMLPLHLLFICLSIYSLICCSSGREEAAWLWAAEHHPFQLHLCGSSESCVLPRPYDGAELHKTCSAVVSSCGKDTCIVTSDKTLHFSECLSFRQWYADCEKQMQSGPFGICATEIQIKVRKIQENYAM